MTEHDDVIRLLREGRPQATEMELDQIKQRVRRRVAASSGRKQPMKSRVAILAMLVTGMVFSTAGAGLALSGSSHHNASVFQYETPTPTPTCTETPGGGTSPAQSSGGGTSPSGGVAPAEATNTQPTRQEAAATNSQLPFTGFAAIPVILGGLALLAGGLLLRRKTRAE